MTVPISILLADDHSMVRRLLGGRLEAETDMTVVATVSNADEPRPVHGNETRQQEL